MEGSAKEKISPDLDVARQTFAKQAHLRVSDYTAYFKNN